MENRLDRLSASEFFEKLQHDKLTTPTVHALRGTVKKSEGSGKTLEFSVDGDCSNWVTIPLALIDSADVLGKIACKDHSHNYVRIVLREPKTDEGKVLMCLLTSIGRQLQSIKTTRRPIARSPIVRGGSPRPLLRGTAGDCHAFHYDCGDGETYSQDCVSIICGGSDIHDIYGSPAF
jgi:hypothetical protein